MAQENNLLIFFYIKADVVKEYRSIGVYRLQSFNFQDLIAWFSIHLEDNSRIFSTRRTNFLHIQSLQHLLARGGLLTFCHIGREPSDKLFQLLALLFSFHLLILSLTQCQLRTLIPERIVAREYRYFTKIDINGLCADGIQEVTVVANHQHRLLYIAQILFQPLHRVKVQVVGRLVKQ